MARRRLVRSLALLVLSLCACARAEPPGPLVLLVSVDTLRADRLGAYGSQLGLTPRLDALAAQSQLFELAYAPAPFTRPAVAALLTGREPARIGVVSNRSALPAHVPTLAGLLSAAGYATGAVVSNPVLQRGNGFERGFARYDDVSTRGEAEQALQGRAAAQTTTAALAMLDALAEAPATGRLLWVHYQDPHGPYTPPPGYRERFLPREMRRPDAARRLPAAQGESGAGAIPAYQVIGNERSPAFYRAGYDGEVAHVDEQIGRLLDGLRERGWLEDAVIVFTADHGEGLGENDYWFAHGENLSEPLLRVPLLIRTPTTRAPEAGVRRDVASLADVPGTLAALLGLDAAQLGAGRRLLAEGAARRSSRVFVSTLGYVKAPAFGMLNQHFRYTLEQRDGQRRERLFRIGSEEDVGAQHPAALERLRLLTEARAGELRAAPAEERRPLGAEERRQLRALGYVDE